MKKENSKIRVFLSRLQFPEIETQELTKAGPPSGIKFEGYIKEPNKKIFAYLKKNILREFILVPVKKKSV